MPMYSSIPAPSKTEYLFIDAASLHRMVAHVGKPFWPGKEVPISYGQIATQYDKVFYYHASPSQKGDDVAEYNAACDAHDAHIAQINAIRGYHAYAGETRHRSNRRGGTQQKMVDVMIAVDMLRHTFNRNMQKCTLLTSDLDFAPLLEALVQEGMWVTVWHDEFANERLLRTADDRKPMNIDTLAQIVGGSFLKDNPIPQKSYQFFNRGLWSFQGEGVTAEGEEYQQYFSTDTGEWHIVFDPNKPGNVLHITDKMSLERAWVMAEHGSGKKRSTQTDGSTN